MNKQKASLSFPSAPPLSAASKALADDLLRGGALRPDDMKTPELSDLTRYLTGMVSASERQEVECALIAWDTSRALLRQVRPVLRRLQAMSWQEVSRQAQTSDLNGQVAQIWLTLMTDQIAAMPEAVAQKRVLGWESLRREAMEGLKEAKIVWESWRTLGQRLHAELSRPRLAVAKGGVTDRPDLAPSLQQYADTLHLEASITPESSLVLALQTAPEQADKEKMPDSVVHFSLLLRGDPWYLGASSLSEGEATFSAQGLGAVLDLPPGTLLPSHLFRVSLEAPVTLVPAPLTLLAEVFETDGSPSPLPPAEVVIAAPLRRDQEELVLDVLLPALTRSAFASYALELDLMLSSEQGQRLGSWAISLWSEETRTLHIPCPGSPGMTSLPISVLRARLKAGANSEGVHTNHERLAP